MEIEIEENTFYRIKIDSNCRESRAYYKSKAFSVDYSGVYFLPVFEGDILFIYTMGTNEDGKLMKFLYNNRIYYSTKKYSILDPYFNKIEKVG